MHIPLDLIEGSHLVSAILLEVPNMAANSHEINKKIISKRLRKLMSYWEDSDFKGPPETLSEHLLAAARALTKGFFLLLFYFIFIFIILLFIFFLLFYYFIFIILLFIFIILLFYYFNFYFIFFNLFSIYFFSFFIFFF